MRKKYKTLTRDIMKSYSKIKRFLRWQGLSVLSSLLRCSGKHTSSFISPHYLNPSKAVRVISLQISTSKQIWPSTRLPSRGPPRSLAPRTRRWTLSTRVSAHSLHCASTCRVPLPPPPPGPPFDDPSGRTLTHRPFRWHRQARQGAHDRILRGVGRPRDHALC